MGSTAKTSFHEWRKEMGFTLDQAAAAVGASKSQVQNWDAGEDRGRPGRKSVPPRSTRILMRLLAGKVDVEPWPE